MFKRNSLTLCAMFVLYLLYYSPAATVAGENNKAQQKNKEIRPLYGEELNDARQARDSADKLFAEYKRLYPCPVSKSPQESRDLEKLISAYKEAVDKFEGTDIAAYCQLRLCEPYKYREEFHKAIEYAKVAADNLAGTAYEARAYFTTGNIYLEALHDAKAAVPWFEKIPQPDTKNANGIASPEEYNEDHKLYLSSQQQIAKCEIKLGNAQNAEKRYEKLSEYYPQFKRHFSDVLKFEEYSELYNRFEIDDVHLLDYVMEPSPSVLASPASQPQNLVEEISSSLPMSTDACKANDKPASETKENVKPANLANNNPSIETTSWLFPTSRKIAMVSVGILAGTFIVLYRLKSRKEGCDMIKE